MVPTGRNQMHVRLSWLDESEVNMTNLDPILPDDNELARTLSDGYASALRENFLDPGLRVLAFCHDDLDGAVSAIVIKNFYSVADVNPISYRNSGAYDAAAAILLNSAAKYDAVVFADFCPAAEDVEIYDALHQAGRPFLVIDHHPKAKNHPDDPNGTYVVDTSKCGALNCLDYFGTRKDLEYLRTLCVITDDHDRWVRKIVPLSDKLNNAFYLRNYDEFIEKYMDGLDGWKLPPDDEHALRMHDAEVDKYMATMELKPLPKNGAYAVVDKYNSDINLRLGEKYDWIVMRQPEEVSPGITKLSFRTKRKDIDLGKILASFGKGGGGHPGAAGQNWPTDSVDEFVQAVAAKIPDPVHQ